MLQINLRWNELYWSSPFFTAESCRFRFLSAPPPTSLSSSKAKGDSMTQPNTDAGRARMQRENMHQLGLPWWCQWYVFFLSHFLLSLSLYLLLTIYWCVFCHDPPWSTNKSAYVDARSMALCVLPGFVHHLKSWARGERHAPTSPFLQWARTWGHHNQPIFGGLVQVSL